MGDSVGGEHIETPRSRGDSHWTMSGSCYVSGGTYLGEKHLSETLNDFRNSLWNWLHYVFTLFFPSSTKTHIG